MMPHAMSMQLRSPQAQHNAAAPVSRAAPPVKGVVPPSRQDCRLCCGLVAESIPVMSVCRLSPGDDLTRVATLTLTFLLRRCIGRVCKSCGGFWQNRMLGRVFRKNIIIFANVAEIISDKCPHRETYLLSRLFLQLFSNQHYSTIQDEKAPLFSDCRISCSIRLAGKC